MERLRKAEARSTKKKSVLKNSKKSLHFDDKENITTTMNQKIKKLMKQGVLCELIVEKVYQKRTVAVMVTSVMNSMSKI